MASASVHRRRGSNKHLAGFLKAHMQEARSESEMPSGMKTETSGNVQTDPHVPVTTSLLSRGLNFSPEIKHVFIVDEPRNMIDFLHRAGRSGRAGESGKVVVFGKMKGRGEGSQETCWAACRMIFAINLDGELSLGLPYISHLDL